MTIITFDTDYLNQTAFLAPHAGVLVLRSFPRNTSVRVLLANYTYHLSCSCINGELDGKMSRST